MPDLRKSQRALSDREKLQECFDFGSGCTDWQMTSQNLFEIIKPNFVG